MKCAEHPQMTPQKTSNDAYLFLLHASSHCALFGKNKYLPFKLKIWLFHPLVIAVVTYGAETWTLKADDKNQLAAFETKSLKKDK